VLSALHPALHTEAFFAHCIFDKSGRIVGDDLNTKNMGKFILFLTVIIPTNILVLLNTSLILRKI